MLKPFVLAVAVMFSSATALAGSQQDQIVHLEAAWLNAYRRGDGEAAAALVSKDVLAIDAEGGTAGGGELYSAIIERSAKVAKLFIRIDDVRPLGEDAAMAAGDYVANVKTDKGEWMDHGYWLRLYVREGNAWKIRASSFSEKEPPTTNLTVL